MAKELGGTDEGCSSSSSTLRYCDLNKGGLAYCMEQHQAARCHRSSSNLTSLPPSSSTIASSSTSPNSMSSLSSSLLLSLSLSLLSSTHLFSCLLPVSLFNVAGLVVEDEEGTGRGRCLFADEADDCGGEGLLGDAEVGFLFIIPGWGGARSEERGTPKGWSEATAAYHPNITNGPSRARFARASIVKVQIISILQS